MTERRRPTKAQQAAALSRQEGACGCGCDKPLAPPIEWDHVLPLGLTGTNADGNWQALLETCHASKTRQDIARIAKAKRQRAYHVGEYQQRKRKKIVSRPFRRPA